MTYLPDIGGFHKQTQRGRNPYEGSQRGWGLQYGKLRNHILEDPLYIDSFNLSQDLTIMTEEKRMNIYLIMRFFLSKIEEGHIVEFGSYKGGERYLHGTGCEKNSAKTESLCSRYI